MKDLLDTTNSWVRDKAESLPADWLEKNRHHFRTLMDEWGSNDLAFTLWMFQLNRHVMAMTGLSARDLQDWDYSTAYESDMTPGEAAFQMLEDVAPDLMAELELG